MHNMHQLCLCMLCIHMHNMQCKHASNMHVCKCMLCICKHACLMHMHVWCICIHVWCICICINMQMHVWCICKHASTLFMHVWVDGHGVARVHNDHHLGAPHTSTCCNCAFFCRYHFTEPTCNCRAYFEWKYTYCIQIHTSIHAPVTLLYKHCTCVHLCTV